MKVLNPSIFLSLSPTNSLHQRIVKGHYSVRSRDKFGSVQLCLMTTSESRYGLSVIPGRLTVRHCLSGSVSVVQGPSTLNSRVRHRHSHYHPPSLSPSPSLWVRPFDATNFGKDGMDKYLAKKFHHFANSSTVFLIMKATFILWLTIDFSTLTTSKSVVKTILSHQKVIFLSLATSTTTP